MAVSVCLTTPNCLQTLTFLNVFSTCRKQRDLDSIKVMLWCVCWAGRRWFLWCRGCLCRAGGGRCGDEAMSQKPSRAHRALGWTARGWVSMLTPWWWGKVPCQR